MDTFIHERYLEVNRMCIVNVKERVKMHEKSDFNPLMNYILGHNYYGSNTRLLEGSARQGVYNSGHMGIPLQIYYIKQEPDFHTWYNIKLIRLNTLHYSQVLRNSFLLTKNMLVDEHYKYWLIKHFHSLDIDIIHTLQHDTIVYNRC